jgi:hypothetical protein
MKKEIICGLVTATILAVVLPMFMAVFYGLTISIINLQAPIVYFSGLLNRIDIQLIAYLGSVWVLIFCAIGIYPSIARIEQ